MSVHVRDLGVVFGALELAGGAGAGKLGDEFYLPERPIEPRRHRIRNEFFVQILGTNESISLRCSLELPQ